MHLFIISPAADIRFLQYGYYFSAAKAIAGCEPFDYACIASNSQTISQAAAGGAKSACGGSAGSVGSSFNNLLSCAAQVATTSQSIFVPATATAGPLNQTVNTSTFPRATATSSPTSTQTPPRATTDNGGQGTKTNVSDLTSAQDEWEEEKSTSVTEASTNTAESIGAATTLQAMPNTSDLLSSLLSTGVTSVSSSIVTSAYGSSFAP